MYNIILRESYYCTNVNGRFIYEIGNGFIFTRVVRYYKIRIYNGRFSKTNFSAPRTRTKSNRKERSDLYTDSHFSVPSTRVFSLFDTFFDFPVDVPSGVGD